MLWQARRGLIAGRAAFNPAAAITDPFFSSVKFLSGFEGADAATTLTEESASARTVTFAGNAQIDTAVFKFGTSSLLLDGSGDLVTCPNSADFQFGSGNWTVEAWARFSSFPGISPIAGLYDTNGQRSWYCAVSAAGTIDIATSTAGTSGATSLSVADTFTTVTQYFFEFNYDGTNLRAFRDGVFKGKAAFSSALFASTAKLSIGGILTSGVPSAGTNFMAGWVDELRITKGVCRHNTDSNYTAPTAPFPRS